MPKQCAAIKPAQPRRSATSSSTRAEPGGAASSATQLAAKFIRGESKPFAEGGPTEDEPASASPVKCCPSRFEATVDARLLQPHVPIGQRPRAKLTCVNQFRRGAFVKPRAPAHQWRDMLAIAQTLQSLGYHEVSSNREDRQYGPASRRRTAMERERAILLVLRCLHRTGGAAMTTTDLAHACGLPRHRDGEALLAAAEMGLVTAGKKAKGRVPIRTWRIPDK